jgi:hypothetical protein
MKTYNISIRGDNHLIGFDLNWGLSYAKSESRTPFDFEAIFVEPSGMNASPKVQTNPKQLISYAVNDFTNTSLYWTYFRDQENSDKEKTAFTDIAKKYTIGGYFSGEFKFGGKYRVKERMNERSEDFTPYYLGKWKTYELLPDGTHRLKDFTGTYFEDWLDAGGGFITIDRFFSEQSDRDVYGPTV